MKRKIFTYLILLLFVFSGFVVNAQKHKNKPEQELIEEAASLYKAGNYVNALPLYSQLLSLHPKDPFYSYRFGVCLLYGDRRNIEQPLKYLTYAADKLEAEEKLYYHLGLAYHLNFRFPEAIKYYEKYGLNAKSEKTASKISNYHIMMCRNGMSLLADIKDLYVISKKEVNIKDFYRSYDISTFGGSFLLKPDVFKTKLDKKKKDNSIVFFSDTNSVVYFSSYGKKDEYGKDIYRSSKLPDGKWGNAERLSNVINTPYDEDYPYILPDGKTLYFCSKGHNTMGGYDIFKSVWDTITKEWGTPQNLDFAINTPFDDILFVTDDEQQFAYFSSVRNSVEDYIMVYKVRIDERPDFTETETHFLAGTNETDSNYLQTVMLLQEKAKLDVNTTNEEMLALDIKQVADDNKIAKSKIVLPTNISIERIIDTAFNFVKSSQEAIEKIRQSTNEVYDYSEAKREELSGISEKIKSSEEKLIRYEGAALEYEKDRINKLKNEAKSISQDINNCGIATSALENLIIKQEKHSLELNSEAEKIRTLAKNNKVDSSKMLLVNLIEQSFKIDTTLSLKDLLNKELQITYNDKKALADEYKSAATEITSDIKSINDEIAYIKKEIATEKNVELQQELNNRIKEAETEKSKNEKLVKKYNELHKKLINETNELNILLDNINQLAVKIEQAKTKDIVAYKNANNQKSNNENINSYEDNSVIENINDNIAQAINNNIIEKNNEKDNIKIDLKNIDYKTNDEQKDNEINISEIKISNINNEVDLIEDDVTESSDDAPVINDDAPVIKDDAAIITDDAPAISDDAPVISDDVPAISDDAAIITDDTPVITDDAPAIKDDAAIISDDAPAIKDDAPAIKDDAAAIKDDAAIISDDAPAILDDAPTISDDAPIFLENNLKTEENIIPIILNFTSELEKLQQKDLNEDNNIVYQTLDVLKHNKQSNNFIKQAEEFEEIHKKALIIAANKSEEAISNKKIAEEVANKFKGKKIELTKEDSIKLITSEQKYIEASKEAKTLIEIAEIAKVKSTQLRKEATEISNFSAQLNKGINQKDIEVIRILSDSLTIISDASITRNNIDVTIENEKTLIIKNIEKNIVYNEQSIQNIEKIISNEVRAIDNLKTKIEETKGRKEKEVLLKEAETIQKQINKKIANKEVLKDSVNKMEIEVAALKFQVNYSSKLLAEIENTEIKKDILDKENENTDVIIETVKSVSDKVFADNYKPFSDNIIKTKDKVIEIVEANKTEIKTIESIHINDNININQETEINQTPENIEKADITEDINLIKKTETSAKEDITVNINELSKEQPRNLTVAEQILAKGKSEKINQITTRLKMQVNIITSSYNLTDNKTEKDSLSVIITEMNKKIDSLDQEYIALNKINEEQVNKQNQFTLPILNKKTEEEIIKQANNDRRYADSLMTQLASKKDSERYLLKSLADSLFNKSKEVFIAVSEYNRADNLQEYETEKLKTELLINKNKEVVNIKEVEVYNNEAEELTKKALEIRDSLRKNQVPLYYADALLKRADSLEKQAVSKQKIIVSIIRRQLQDKAPDDKQLLAEAELFKPTEIKNDINTEKTFTSQIKDVVIEIVKPEIKAKEVFKAEEKTSDSEQIINIKGLFYTVQVGVFGSPRTKERLFNFDPLYYEQMSNGNYRYLAGIFQNRQDAQQARANNIIRYVPDAFVVAYFNGDRITMQEAIKLESENIAKATAQPMLAITTTETTTIATQQETKLQDIVAGKIEFKVQIGAFRREVDLNALDNFKQTAGTDNITYYINASNLLCYTAGSFDNLSEAQNLRAKIITSGISDAFVVAFMGGNRITLQRAEEYLR